MTKNNQHNSQPAFAKRVFDAIEHSRVTPRPRWVFVFSNIAFWAAATIAIIVAAYAAAATIFVFVNAGWQYAPITHGTFFAFLVAALPSLWLVTLAVLAFVVYLNIHRTRRGYRYSMWVIIAVSVTIAVLGGAVLFSAGVGREVEEGLGQHVPFYHTFLGQERGWWMDADNGLLVGRVVSITPDFSSFTIRTDSGRIWHIDASDLRGTDIKTITRGGAVHVVGVPFTATTSGVFHACFVFPWTVYGASSQTPEPLTILTSSQSEIISRGERSNMCRSIRSYTLLRALEKNKK